MYKIFTVVSLNRIKNFQWDKGNLNKSYEKHGITPKESEEIFLDARLQVIKDIKHSQKEKRFIALGKISAAKLLFIVFTLRRNQIRIISSRKANQKERRKIMPKKLKTIPKFKSEKQEREFWQTHDSTEYVDWSKAENWQFPNLKLTSKPITIRLPQSLIDRFKIKAHQLDIPYQSLIKQVLMKEASSL